jgi:tetratricopeptide (TPR) repeat protein
MQTVDQLLQSAIQLHRDGQWSQAGLLYQQVLASQPARADVWNLLGLTLRQSADPAQSIEAFRRAIALDPAQAAYFGNIADALRSQNMLPEALDCCRQAVRLSPSNPVMQYQLAALYRLSGPHELALAIYQQAIELQSDQPHPHYALAGVLVELGRPAEAIEHYRRAIELEPDHADALCDLSALLRSQQRHAEALACLEQAVERRPACVRARSDLGTMLFEAGRAAEARQQFELSVELAPSRAGLHFNLASANMTLGRFDEVQASLNRALELDPGHADAHCARGAQLLLTGQFAAGWEEYEHRVRCPDFNTRDFPQPRWQGEPLAGRTLLVHSEQGLGDTLQFIRYLRQLRGQHGTVLVSVQPSLIPLLAGSGVPNLLPAGQPLPPFDVHVPTLSLPRALGTRADIIPSDVPYLQAEPKRVDFWRQRLREVAGYKVGIVWQGRPDFRADRDRSIPLAAFAPLAAVDGVRLLSLQKGPGSEQVAALGGSFAVLDLAAELDNEGAAFVDTAAVMKCLDLVITSDTAAAHLAGALAVPVWVALGKVPDWRWLLEREDSPWYPTMRLFRQRTPGDWQELFERMAQELARR